MSENFITHQITFYTYEFKLMFSIYSCKQLQLKILWFRELTDALRM